ncbi:MAG TPA: alpha/beta fold hydrolase [Planctomycetes bacterium]|nr:alpha/beta fold hydrolase [Planctomycetota bacterium]HIK60968.1 alpha/beta fold hydrolase [Planctomycetota bacterium]
MSPASYPAPGQMEAFFIGPADSQLFACYHPAQGRARSLGFVLCPPLGQEAIQFHRSLRLLARLLSEVGFPVLRFDFRGCGDSAGDHEDWSLENWRQDVERALVALKEKSGVENLGLVGIRMGASVALAAAADRGGVQALVSWDALLDGSVFLEEARAQHQDMLSHAHVRVDMDPAGAGRSELLGFPLPESLVDELESLRLSGLVACPARQALVVESFPRFPQDGLHERLGELGAEASLQHHETDQLWAWTEDFAKVHIPRKILEAIRGWAQELPS